jgi:collagenase-like PrtC family protease
MPADFKPATIDAYERLNRKYDGSRVMETYGNITRNNTFESGRPVNLLPDVDLERLKEYIGYSAARGIEFNYTLNASTLQNREFTPLGIAEIRSFLGRLHNAGVRNVTVTLPALMEIVWKSGFDFSVKVSTISQVTNAEKAMFYKGLGADRLVVDESINRDFDALGRIRRRFGDKVELIVNVVCYKNCVYRMPHYNQMSYDSVKLADQTSYDYFGHRCVLQRFDAIANLLKLNWIRPEDLKYYNEIGITRFKLQGRQAMVNGDPLRALEAYFQQSYDGDLMELLDMFDPTSSFRVPMDNKKLEGFIQPFVKNDRFCRSDCETCGYCETMARKAIDFPKAQEIVRMAREFFKEYDRFDGILQQGGRQQSRGPKKLFTQDMVDADFEFSD